MRVSMVFQFSSCINDSVGMLIKWDYIIDFYNTYKVMSLRMAPKLKDKHITLLPFPPM